jgi:hypothetical protein
MHEQAAFASKADLRAFDAASMKCSSLMNSVFYTLRRLARGDISPIDEKE